MSEKIGRLEPVPIRELWKHEERGFSAWLEQNLDLLSEKLHVDLSCVEREKSVGPFSVDLLAEDSDHNPVVIENQLEPTDHDHLGKVVTYLTNLDAKMAIWITRHPRPEHVRAIEWLNEATAASFYLVKLEAYRIGDSQPAPHFTIVAGPTVETKELGAQKKDWAERHILHHKFWGQLIEKSKQSSSLHAQRAPTKDHWLSAGAGKAGLSFQYLIWNDEGGIQLNIDTADKEENKRIFDYLYSQRAAVERQFGKALDWRRLDDKKSSRIDYVSTSKGLRDGERVWPEIQEAMIADMDRFSKILKPLIASYKGSTSAEGN